MKFFNTAGPVDPSEHYYVPHRFNEPEIRQLIEQKKYYILHAPRQSGKTTGLLQIVKMLNNEGQYKALYVNFEPAQGARSNVIDGMSTILKALKIEILNTFGTDDPGYQFLIKDEHTQRITGNSLQEFLNYWANHVDKPLVIFIDEIDSLVGDTLISVLRQLRAGYTRRPFQFPQSVCLVGVRDVRDYRIYSDQEGAMVLGGSAFNIKSESLTLPGFTPAQVRNLYEQHTAETGQKFTDEAIAYAYEQTQGQPWLVNALAYQACFRDVIDRSQPITLEVMERAKEELIRRRDTHIDVLIDRLEEPRVRNIIQAILIGGGGAENFPTDDLQYVRDLGLIKPYGIAIANPIYQEIIPRELAYTKQAELVELQKTSWYLRADGSLDMKKLLAAFTEFFRENSEFWLKRFAYEEAGPHILLMAFLQRIINGGGSIHREYALGRRRVDLLVLWKNQRIVVEMKLWNGPKALEKGLEQTAEYMDTSRATEGHLVIFDRRLDKSWDERIYHRQEMVGDKTIDVWGM